MHLLQRSFRAMNTDMRILLYAPAGSRPRYERALAAAEGDIRAQEARFSRFLGESELSQLNHSAGRWMIPSAEMLEVLELAQRLHRETGGLFNPGVLPVLEWSGYDRSFELLSTDRPAQLAPLLAGIGIESLEFDGERVRLPAGCRLDLGGIVKGWTADHVADALAYLGPALVDLGGDIAVRGRAPGGAWRIGVESPRSTGGLLTMISVRQGGVATSGTVRRQWRRGNAVLHHIIDPRTGAPARSDIVQAVVVAESAVRADVWAKTALILGRDGCEEVLHGNTGLELMLVAGDGSATATSGICFDRSRAA